MQLIPIEKDEIIGKQVCIETCTDPTLEKLHGMILDETKNMILINTERGRKWVAKNTATFSFSIKSTPVTIQGSKLRFRPEERVKKAR